MAQCLYGLYEDFFEKALAAREAGDRDELDRLWSEALRMTSLQRIVTAQAFEDVDQRLPKHSHAHFCRLHNLKGCPSRQIDESDAA